MFYKKIRQFLSLISNIWKRCRIWKRKHPLYGYKNKVRWRSMTEYHIVPVRPNRSQHWHLAQNKVTGNYNNLIANVSMELVIKKKTWILHGSKRDLFFRRTICKCMYLKFTLCSRSNSYYNPCLSLLFTNRYTKKVGTLFLHLQGITK